MTTSRNTQEIYYYNEQTEPPEFTEGERAAMRAYLQRCEVRISTLHRIATAFVSGAGLLLLIPIFFKDVVDNLIIVLLDNWGNQFSGDFGVLLTALLYLTILYPLILSLAIPLYGMYLLLKDIVHFYFTIYTPGLPDNLLIPTFSLTATSFSPDESLKVKKEVMRYQYEADKMNFMIPFSQAKRELYFDQMITNTQSGIIPDNRQFDTLDSLGVLNGTGNDKDVARFNAALGITGSLDRALVQEVAVTEMLQVRNILYMRRLVLRYVKIFLMFIWTMFIAFMMLPLLKDTRLSPFMVLSVGYLVWSVAVMPILHTPINWLYYHRKDDIQKPEHIDAQLLLFERGVQTFAYLAITSSIIALILSLFTIGG